MDSEDIGPRDLENLRVPAIARVGRDEAHAWQLFDAGGSPVSGVRQFLAHLDASDTADSTLRSYAYDLLRWFRFLAAVEVEWPQQAAERSAASSDASAQPTTPNEPEVSEPEVSSPLPAQRQEHSIHTWASRT
jgi:hypothetical protein